MNEGKKVLLAFGEGALNRAVHRTLQEADFQVTKLSWTEKVRPAKGEARPCRLPKERYDYLIQIGKDPAALTEGTRHLLEKARKERAEFLLISSLKASTEATTTKEATYLESLHFAEALTREFQQRYGVSATVLRLPTVFGPGIPPTASGTLGYLISEFSRGSTLTVYGEARYRLAPGEGKESNYYLYLTDAADAVGLALTLKDKEGGVYHAAPPALLSSTAIAETLKEMGGGRHEICYHKGLVAIEEEIKLEGKALPHFKPQVSLEEGILETLKAPPVASTHEPSFLATLRKRVSHLWRPRHEFKLPVSAVTRIPEAGRGNKVLPKGQVLTREGSRSAYFMARKKRMLQLAVILLILSPLLYIGGEISLATYRLSQLRRQIGNFDFEAASRSAARVRSNLIALNRFFGAIPVLSRKTPLRDLRLINQGGVEASTALVKLLAEGETALTALENLVRSYQGETINEQSVEEFNRLATALKETEENLLTTWLYLDRTQPSFHRLLAPYLSLLQEGLTATRLGAAFAADAPDLLGYRGERSYLILFQNSAEARAGGGFLGSLARLTLENGGIKELEFFDSYQFDKFRDEPDPPMPALKTIVAVPKPPLRESNFYASFPESGRRISHLFELAQDVEIDGVIGVNLFLAKELINITGPLELGDFERTVTAGNLFEVTTEEVEKGFFPGSSKKRRFLQALGEGLLSKLFTLGKESYTNLAKVVWKGLEKKDLLLFFEKGSPAQALAESGFDGRVKTTKGDFLMILDSNYGTKANIWIKRDLNYKVFNVNRADQLQGELTVTWTHSGTKAWPAGNYGNLFRALVPKGSRLAKASLNGEDYRSQIFITKEAGKTEFATHLLIKPQTKVTLKLSYNLPPSLNLDDLKHYSLHVQKQPGTTGDPFTFTFEEPFGKRVLGAATPTIAPPSGAGRTLQKEGGNLIFKGKLERDIRLVVEINPKLRREGE